MSLLWRLRPRSGKELYFLLMAFLMPMQVFFVIRKPITVFHVINVPILGLYLAMFILQRRRIRWYLLLPMWIYLVGSVAGMFSSEVLGINLYTLSQDLYLYVWFVALCLLITSERDISYLTTAWIVAALLVVLVGVLLPSSGELREEFTFANPNRAASYFMVASFLLFSPAFRGRSLLRLTIAGIFGWAIFATGSLGTFASLFAGGAVFMSVYLYIRGSGSWVPRQVGFLLLAGLLMYASTAVDFESLQARYPLSFGRLTRSFESRQDLWDRGMEEFRNHPFGIGPASFHYQVESGLGLYGTSELHSDYFATLVERGVVGFLGLVVLFIVLGRFIYELVQDARRLGQRTVAVWAAALSGLLVAYFSYSLTHEALHHDTLWASMALLVAQRQIQRRHLIHEVTRPAPLQPLRTPVLGRP